MSDRITEELALIRREFPDVVYREEGRWVLISSYPLPAGWNRVVTDVVFQIGEGHPATPPYGFYVPSGIQFQGTAPNNYTDQASNKPPFDKAWSFFSWAPEVGHWKPAAAAHAGSNLLHWVRGFGERFREGA
ncbi:MAG: hypothetical protein OXK79_08320 [Chloroflexota bacterium]|nr:hypothetical protein [Chloroflexota bacterium]